MNEGFLLNKEEAIDLQKEIVSSCNGLSLEDISLELSSLGKPVSHGYQLHIKSNSIETNLPRLKTIAQKHYLALDESKKDLVVIYRPCFSQHENQSFF